MICKCVTNGSKIKLQLCRMAVIISERNNDKLFGNFTRTQWLFVAPASWFRDSRIFTLHFENEINFETIFNSHWKRFFYTAVERLIHRRMHLAHRNAGFSFAIFFKLRSVIYSKVLQRDFLSILDVGTYFQCRGDLLILMDVWCNKKKISVVSLVWLSI